MLKFIHITDTHLVERGQVLYGLDPSLRLSQCIDSILRDHFDAALCVVTGDLAHVGQRNAYQILTEQLQRLPMPVLPILGNHDSRTNFKEYFPQVPTDASGFVQYVVPIGQYCGLFLDTNEPGVSHGVLCEQRAQWLKERLAENERPVLLFMHHPAFHVGIPSMDCISLLDARPFRSAIEAHQHRIKHLFFGHIHRPIFGSWHGVPFSTLRGTNHQVALRLDDCMKVPGSHEPPQYGVVLLDEGIVTVHLHDYLDASERFWL
jgi:3',5'-cyclic AMP phosphodiesterase CpdA